jgi:hypothetical protein
MSESTRTEAAERARDRATAAAADRLLNDPVLREALDELSNEQIQLALFAATPDMREDARRQVVGLDRLRASLRAAVEHVAAKHGGPDPARFE